MNLVDDIDALAQTDLKAALKKIELSDRVGVCSNMTALAFKLFEVTASNVKEFHRLAEKLRDASTPCFKAAIKKPLISDLLERHT